MQKQSKSSDVSTEAAHQVELPQGVKSVLWPGGTLKVVNLPFNDELHRGLTFSRRCRQLRGGLESIEAYLQREEAGLARFPVKKSSSPHRISRLLIMANDGSERMFRNCERLLVKYEARLFGIRTDVPGAVLGTHFFGMDKNVKVLLVSRRECVERVLSYLQAK